MATIDDGWNYQDPAASERNFRAYLEQGEGLNDSNYVAEVLTQLARSLGMQQRFEEAHALLDRCEDIASESTPRIRLALERGRLLNSSGDPEASIAHFETGLTLAEVAGNQYLAIDAAHMLGIVTATGTAIEWNERAIKMAEAATEPRARHWLGPLRNNLAWTYNDQGQHAKALELFEQDIAFRESESARFEASIARWSKASTLRLLGRTTEALAELEALLDHPDRQGNAAEGYTHEEIGECLLTLQRAEAAAPHFAIAFARLNGDPWLQANEAERLQRLHRLSRIDE